MCWTGTMSMAHSLRVSCTWTSGGIQTEFTTHKGECSPVPCPNETGAEHAARHKTERNEAVAELPVIGHVSGAVGLPFAGRSGYRVVTVPDESETPIDHTYHEFEGD